MWVKPSLLWNRKIIVPVAEGGIYSASRKEQVHVSDAVGQWLIENSYAEAIEIAEAKEAKVLEPWQISALALLEENPQEVKGIPAEVLEIVAGLSRPLSWEALESALRPKQIQTIKKIIEENVKQ